MGMRKILTGIMLVAAVGLVATATYAQGGAMERVGDQWKIAMEHSKLAQKYSNTKEIQQHLQHVINCIEGKGGGMFDASQGHPCEGKGTGMMADAKAAGGKAMKGTVWMDMAGQVAAIGMKAKSADTAKAAAWMTEQALQQAGNAIR
jgi:hypothetical protein